MSEIGDFNVIVTIGFALTPQEQCLLGRMFGRASLILIVVHFIVLYVLYLETQNDGPKETKYQGFVAIDNVLCADTFKSDLALWKEENHQINSSNAKGGS